MYKIRPFFNTKVDFLAALDKHEEIFFDDLVLYGAANKSTKTLRVGEQVIATNYPNCSFYVTIEKHSNGMWRVS